MPRVFHIICIFPGIIVPGGFEPPSQAPKAFRIDRYPTGLVWFILLNHSGPYKIYIAFSEWMRDEASS